MKSRVAEPNLCSTSPPPRASRKTQFIQHPSRHQGPKGTDPTYPGPGPGELPFSDDEQALAQPKGPTAFAAVRGRKQFAARSTCQPHDPGRYQQAS